MHAEAMAQMPKRLEHLFDRIEMKSAPLMAKHALEPTANIEDVFQDMHTGDGLWYAGTSFFAWLIRISDYANVSHAGVILRDGNTLESIRCMDVIESFAWKKGGGRNLPLVEQVKKAPGYWYWGPIADPYLEVDPKTKRVRFSRSEAEKAARALIGSTYGWRGIGLMGATRLPIAREIMYAIGRRDIDKAWEDQPPFCSWAQSLIWQAAGVDPVPGRAPQLTSPANTFSSLLCGPKIALT